MANMPTASPLDHGPPQSIYLLNDYRKDCTCNILAFSRTLLPNQTTYIKINPDI